MCLWNAKTIETVNEADYLCSPDNIKNVSLNDSWDWLFRLPQSRFKSVEHSMSNFISSKLVEKVATRAVQPRYHPFIRHAVFESKYNEAWLQTILLFDSWETSLGLYLSSTAKADLLSFPHCYCLQFDLNTAAVPILLAFVILIMLLASIPVR